MKNFKPQKAAPKGALCACKDALGPHSLNMAGGGSVKKAVEGWQRYLSKRNFKSPEEIAELIRRKDAEFMPSPEEILAQVIAELPTRQMSDGSWKVGYLAPPRKEPPLFFTDDALIGRQARNATQLFGRTFDGARLLPVEDNFPLRLVNPTESVDGRRVDLFRHLMRQREPLPPLLIDDNDALADGHHRLEAAKSLKLRKGPVLRWVPGDSEKFAEGGSVPSADDMKLWDLPALLRAYLSRPDSSKPGAMSPEAYDARLLGARRPMTVPGTRRRPEALNASRGVNLPAQALRGFAAGTAGLPGDVEGLLRMLTPGVSNTPALPTGEFFDSVLPGRDERPAARAAAGAGSLFAGLGLPQAARGVQKVAAPVAKGALATIARGMEGQGPLAALVAPSAPAFAMRPRGGNFAEPNISDLGGWFAEPDNVYGGAVTPVAKSPQQAWADKVLRNYVKRDLGAPTDPLLALEKEIPGLHLPQGHLQAEGEHIADLYFARQQGAERPSLLLPQRFGPQAEKVQRATTYLDKHEVLSGGTRLTPWGRVSDAEVIDGTAGKDLAAELEAQWPLSMMYPGVNGNPQGSVQGLLDYTNSLIDRFDQPSSVGHRNRLLEFREKISDAMANDWRAKKPEAPLYSLVGGAGERLGFDHIMDYIEAATDPYTRLKQNFGRNVGTPQDDYTEAAKRIFGYRNPDEAYENFVEGMHPYSRETMREWYALRDAGLLIDPASLDRMSVPDMVRRVAKWNEYMEAKRGAGEAEKLMKGARVFKEYGADAGPSAGMKWVEFASPEDGKFFTPETLPEGWKLEEFDRGGDVGAKHYAITSGGKTLPTLSGSRFNTPEDALTAFTDEFHRSNIAEGLKAEGDAMGHCVGGYCDDVAQRGTKIYSLRDAKGQPHVTIEVRPKSTGAYLRAPVDNEPDFERFLESYDEVERLLPIEARAAWDDLNGPNGDAEEAINWLKKTQPTVYEKVFAPKPELEIIQIKGKGNEAPAEKYRAAVQDFVKSGKWGRVGDLRNTGLIAFPQGAVSNFRVGPDRRLIQTRIPPGYHTAEEIQRILMDQGVPEAEARSHAGNFGGTRYAHGGSVQPDAPKGFLPRSFPEWVEYAERVYAERA